MGQIITISAKFAGKSRNATPAVVEALAQLCKIGGTLVFEQGEYHFRPEGGFRRFLGVSNNSAGEKSIAFPIINAQNVTVDGNGATFVFYNGVFPFCIEKSSHIEIKNIIYDIPVSPMAVMRVKDKSDKGYTLEIDEKKTAYKVQNGELVFLVNGGERKGQFALHATERLLIRYLYAGADNTPAGNLPVPFMHTVARQTAEGVEMTYLEDNQAPCPFKEGEVVISTLFGGRSACACLMSEAQNVRIKNFNIRRCIGMGMVGQRSRDIEIDGFTTDEAYHGEGWTLTADALHFINCYGKLDIHNCRISHTKDDAINVHGNYTVLDLVKDGRIYADIKHREQAYFNPYGAGDHLAIIDPVTLDIVAYFVVDDSKFADESGKRLVVTGRFEGDASRIGKGCLIENPDKMPDLHLHHNHFSHFPHMRLSGAGEILVEENELHHCSAALFALDLFKYWYESGRIRHLVFRNNLLDDCNGKSGTSFMTIGIDGIEPERAPRIHDTIEIRGNTFLGIKKRAIKASGVKKLIVEDNTFDRITDELVCVDGKPLKY